MGQRAVGIIVKNNKFLLANRGEDGREYFYFPGGEVEEDENIGEALARELDEELGIEINDSNLIFELENQFADFYGNLEKGYDKEFYFIVSDFNGEPKVKELSKINNRSRYSMRWMSLAEMEDMNNFYPKEAIQKLLSVFKDDMDLREEGELIFVN